MKAVEFEFGGEKLIMRIAGKFKDGSPAVRIEDETGVPYAKLTFFAEDSKLQPGEFLVKSWAENEMVFCRLLALGLLTKTGRSINSGYTHGDVCLIPGLT